MCDYEHEPYACPNCHTERQPEGGNIFAERDGERVQVAWYVECPECSHTLESGPTKEEEDRMAEAHRAAEDAYYKAQYEAAATLVDSHDCKEDTPFFQGGNYNHATRSFNGATFRKGCDACRDALNLLGWCAGHPYDYRPYPDLLDLPEYDEPQEPHEDLPF